MKKILLLLFLTINIAFSQIPNQFNYQGVARDINGNPIANKLIKIKLSILANGTSIYSETFERTTSQFGLFVLPVGGGTVVSGNFVSISWIDQSQKVLKTEIDPDGNGYSLIGDAPLLSVPYALSAKTVESESQKLILAGGLLSISQGNSVDISGLGLSQWTNISGGINYNAGKVVIGDATSVHEGWFKISKNATGAERTYTIFENTSDAQDSNLESYYFAGTGTNRVGLEIGVNAKSYFPNLSLSAKGFIRSPILALCATGDDASSNSFITFMTGANYATNLDGNIERMRIEKNGFIGMGTITPTQKLDVNGKVRIQDLALDNNAAKVLVADATGVLGYRDAGTLIGTSQWVNNSLGINYNSGRVGIGTNAPSTRLHIIGDFTGLERNPIELQNMSTAQDAICGIGLAINTTDRGALQLFGNTYFPTTLPFWSGRLILSATNNNGILLDATSGTTSNIEFAIGPKNGQQTPVRMIVGYSGNVGIGTITPTQKLDVNGKVRIQDLALDNTASKVLMADATGVLGYRDLNTFSPWVSIAGGINYNAGKVVIGDPVSIHEASFMISKNATGAARNYMVLENTSDATDSNFGTYYFAGTGTNRTSLDIGINANSYFANSGLSGNAGIRSGKLAIIAAGNDASSESYIKFMTGANFATDINGNIERMRIEKNGFIGIGTTTPKATLHIKGSVYLEDATQGMIMRSPNGQCWKVTVADNGVLTSTSVTCP